MKIKKEIINKIRETQKEKDEIYKKYKTISTVLTKEEFKRLKKALKEEKDTKLRDWAYCLGLQISDNLERIMRKEYVRQFEQDISRAVDEYRIILCNVLHFNEKCKFGAKRIQDVMDDLEVTVELLNKGEFTIDDYINQLKKEKIEICDRKDRK